MAIRSGSGIEINTKVLCYILGAMGLVIYSLYNFAPVIFGRNVLSSKQLMHDSWKTKPFVQIDDVVKKRMPSIKVQELEVSFMMGDDRLSIFYRESSPWNKNEKAKTVVLLHGAGDHSKWWEDIGTFNMLSAAGYHVVGLDLPGWGMSKTNTVKDTGKFLGAFLKELGIEKPILVASSLGGQYALPYLMEPRPITCDSRAAGFVPIAIVGTDQYKPAEYHRCSVPTMIVFGTNDTKLGLYSVGDLRNLANNHIVPMEKAGHACARERPAEWHMLLYNFLLQVAPTEKPRH